MLAHAASEEGIAAVEHMAGLSRYITMQFQPVFSPFPRSLLWV